jgi:F-type H+-transporting ATPase subunit alpha
VEEQVVVLLAGTRGHLDEIPVGDVRRFEKELLEFVRTRHGDLLDTIRTTGSMPEGDVIEDAIRNFRLIFQSTGGDHPQPVAGGDAPRTDGATAPEGGGAVSTQANQGGATPDLTS